MNDEHASRFLGPTTIRLNLSSTGAAQQDAGAEHLEEEAQDWQTRHNVRIESDQEMGGCGHGKCCIFCKTLICQRPSICQHQSICHKAVWVALSQKDYRPLNRWIYWHRGLSRAPLFEIPSKILPLCVQDPSKIVPAVLSMMFIIFPSKTIPAVFP